MIHTKLIHTELPRRLFLKGMGLSVGLPFLESVAGRHAFAGQQSAGQRPVRMALVFFPNGAIMSDWTPAEIGTEYELSSTLTGLAEFKSDINVISGLAQDNGRHKGDGPGDHARCAASFLTGAHPHKTDGADIRAGVSVDQIAAEKIGGLTKLPSLELGIERGRNAGGCDSGYSCAYSSNISWKTPTTPVAKEINPRLAFERLFGAGKDAGKARAERDFYRRSILDLVAEDAAKWKARLGQTDRRKLDEYFTNVRELEQRIVASERNIGQQPPAWDGPSEIPGDVTEHVRLMFDLMVLAFRTDTTRVATFMMGNAGSNRTYPMVGVNDGHHQISHHGDDEEKVAKIRKIDRYLADQFAYFVGKLKSTADGDHTLLDNSMILYGSGLADGHRHQHHNLPIVLAGSGGGTIKTGRHIKIQQETPLNNLFLSMLDRAGAGTDSLGDSSGRLNELAV